MRLLRDLTPSQRACCLKTEGFAAHEVTASGLPVKETVDEGPPDVLEVEVCRQWLGRRCHPSPHIAKSAHSYRLKHMVGEYVGNGAMIVAALSLGYKARRCHATSVNALLNVVIEDF